MVSQKFMDILYQQPDYTNSSTSSSSSATDRNEQNTLQVIRKDDNCRVTPSTSDDFIIDNNILEPLTIITEEKDDMKEGNEDMNKEENVNIKEEIEDDCDDLHLFGTENKNKYMNEQTSASFWPKKDSNKNLPSPCMSPPFHLKDKEVLRPPSKQMSREKDGLREENEDMIKEKNAKIEEEIGDNRHDLQLFDTENKNKYPNKQTSASFRTAKDGNKNLPSPCMSPPSHLKDKEGLRPPSKRMRREKIIFDPSETSNSMQKNNKRKIPSEVNDLSCVSDKSKQCSEIPIDTMNKHKEQGYQSLYCQYCGKYMHRLDYLRLHLMKHTGETPYKCQFCKNAYRARWRLNQHLRTHTRNLPYHCPYCCYRGNRSDYLTSHINRIHKNLQKECSEKPKKDHVANDNEENKVDTVKEEKLSESELNAMIKQKFSPSCHEFDEEHTSNSR